MDVAEVTRLADWFEKNIVPVQERFSALVRVLQNNSQQASQQPVTPPLNDLLAALVEMPTDEISLAQVRVLEGLSVDKLIGVRGRHWVDQTVRASTYDPATTYQSVQQATSQLDNARQKLVDFRSSVRNLGIAETSIIDPDKPFSFSVVFKNGASIDNLRDWKRSAGDWEYIVSSVATVAGERPEDVSVITAHSGSIVLWLGASAMVTKIVATISKHIASIANDYLDFQIKREELRRSRMMSRAIEEDLQRQESERRINGKSMILDQVRSIVPNAKPEDIGKLDKALDKFIEFAEKGGELDFVSPPLSNLVDVSDADDSAGDSRADLHDVDQVIRDYRSEVQRTKLLSDGREQQ